MHGGRRTLGAASALPNLAAHFAADHVAAGKNVRHVCAQEFIDADLPFFPDLDSRFLDRDLVRVRLAACGDQEFLGAQFTRLAGGLSVDDDFFSLLANGTHGSAGDQVDAFFFENFTERLADCGFIAVRKPVSRLLLSWTVWSSTNSR